MEHPIILMDGATGTMLWERIENKVPVWRYNLENPQTVLALQREYVEAGAELIESNTFGANGTAVARSPYSVQEIVSSGVRLAREAAGDRARVALSIGPLSELLEPYGDLTEEEATALYEEQIGAGMSEHPDIIMLETFLDVEMLKIALGVANRYEVPTFCSMSFGKTGKTMMGNSVADMLAAVGEYRVGAVGLNCSMGPDLALPVMAEFRRLTTLPLLFKPNAGKPQVDGNAVSPEFDLEVFAKDMLTAAELGVTYLGGCCGSTPAYIRCLAERLRR